MLTGTEKTKNAHFVAYGIFESAAAREAGITYSRLIEGLKAANVDINRKVLADLAATDSSAFCELVNTAKGALEAKG